VVAIQGGALRFGAWKTCLELGAWDLKLREPGEPPSHNPDGASAGHSVWWQWTAPSDGDVVISTEGSSFDTVAAIYTGNTVDNLRLLGWNNDGNNSQAAILRFFALAGTTYHIAIDGVPGATGGIQLNVRYNLRRR
jgi:hypothetical protein